MEIKQWAENGNWKAELDLASVFEKLANRHLELFKPLAVLTLKYKPEWSEVTAKYVREFIEMRSKVSHSKEMTVLWALRRLYELAENHEGKFDFAGEGCVSTDETKEEGQLLWVSAKTIGIAIQEYGIGTLEEFGKYPESTIGRILSEFGFVGTMRVSGGNMRKVKISTLSERCLTYLGTKLMDNYELSHQERQELIARTLREHGNMTLEQLFDSLNGMIEQDRILAIIKQMRTNGIIMSSGQEGQGVITWIGQ